MRRRRRKKTEYITEKSGLDEKCEKKNQVESYALRGQLTSLSIVFV